MGTHSINVLSICAGIGGIDLGLHRAIEGARTVCYVEREASALAILATQIKNGALDDAPIWSDAVTFDGKPWRGAVDIIAAGFPCQSISTAGKRQGIKTHTKSGLWFQVKRIIEEIQPQQVFLENVGNIVAKGLDQVLSDLAKIGYDAEWLCCYATDAGINQARLRWFCLAYCSKERKNAANAEHGSSVLPIKLRRAAEQCPGATNHTLLKPALHATEAATGEFNPDTREIEWPEFVDKSDAIRAGLRVSDWLDRASALGNAVVPDQAAYAYRILSERIREHEND